MEKPWENPWQSAGLKHPPTGGGGNLSCSMAFRPWKRGSWNLSPVAWPSGHGIRYGGTADVGMVYHFTGLKRPPTGRCSVVAWPLGHGTLQWRNRRCWDGLPFRGAKAPAYR